MATGRQLVRVLSCQTLLAKIKTPLRYAAASIMIRKWKELRSLIAPRSGEEGESSKLKEAIPDYPISSLAALSGLHRLPVQSLNL